jgi:hypothetical protein
MRINTNIKSGSFVNDAWNIAVGTGQSAVDFVNQAENQASNLVDSTISSANTMIQGFVGLFR